MADGLAELQVRWPTIPLVFCETRKLAEEWTYRYLAAAFTWAQTEPAVTARMHARALGGADPGPVELGTDVPAGVALPAPSTAEVRAWARAQGLPVSDRGRLRPEVHTAWRDAHPDRPASSA